ncbi:MAG: two-component regulator propeller domain-containing protein [bacterium]
MKQNNYFANRVILFLIVFFATLYAGAQTDYRFQQFVIDQKNGLPSNNVNAIAFDDLGFLWVSTDAGLTRYAGDSSIHFTVNSHPVLESNIFSSLLAKDSVIWASNSGELYKVNTHDLSLVPMGVRGRFGRIGGMISYDDSTLVLSTQDGYVLNFNLKQNKIEGFRLLKSEILSICKDNTAGVFIMFGGRTGMYRVNPITHKILAKYSNLISSWYSKIRFVEGLGILHIGDQFIHQYDSANDRFVRIFENSPRLRALQTQDNLLVTVTTDNKIFVSDSKTRQELYNGYETEIKNVRTDAERNLIIAVTRKGLILFRQQRPFEHIKEYNSPDSFTKIRRSIVEDQKRKRIYFFHQRGADVWSMNEGKFIKSIGGFINSYGVDQDEDYFYVASDGAGITSIRKDDLKTRQLIKLEKYSNNYVCIKKLHSGDFLLGTYNGIKYLKNNTFDLRDLELFYHGEEFKNLLVHKIVETASKGIWLATNKGIFVLDDQFHVQRRYARNESTPFNMPSSETNVLLATDSGMYAGLNDGLFFIPYNRKAGYTVFSSLLSQDLKIISLFPDTNNRLWMSTYTGIFCYDLNRKLIRAFHAPAYFNNDEFNRASSLFSSDGRIYFGSVSEYLKLDPKNYTSTQSSFPLRINKITLLTKKGAVHSYVNFRSGYSIDLPSHETQLNVSFFYQDLVNLPATRYFYKIEETAQDWIPMGNTNTLSLFRLPEGKVVLRIKALNIEDGSSAETSLPFFVPTPFYKTAWFYLLSILSVALLVYSLYNYRMKQFRKFLALRLDLGNELHDTIGTISTKMIFAAETIMRQQTKRDPKLERIVGYGMEINNSFRDALWSVDRNTDSIDNLIGRMIEIAYQSIESTHFNLKVDKQENIPIVNFSPLQKRNILLILREALHNVIKHSNGDLITLLVEVKDRQFCLVVNDNGQGPRSIEIDKGYGIRSMRQRASRMNGDLNFIIDESSFSVELVLR